MEKNNVSTKTFLEFRDLLTKLQTIEFIGITQVLCVEIYGEDKEPRPFEEILSDTADKFLTLRRKQRRELLKQMRLAVK